MVLAPVIGTLITSVVHVMVTGPDAIRALMTAPSAAVIATTGMTIGTAPATVGEMVPAALL